MWIFKMVLLMVLHFYSTIYILTCIVFALYAVPCICELLSLFSMFGGSLMGVSVDI